MNERSRWRFGMLEVIFLLVAGIYLGYVYYANSSADEESDIAAAAESTAVPTGFVVVTATQAPASESDTVESQSASTQVFVDYDTARLTYLETNTPDEESVSQNQIAFYLERGALYEAIEDYGAALGDYTEILAIADGNIEARVRRAALYAELGEYALAVSDYTQVLAFELKADYYIGRGEAQLALEQDASALDDYNRALELDNDNAAAYNGRGEVHLWRDENVLAMLDFQRALELDPSNLVYVYNVGRAYEAQGDSEGAIAQYNEALRRDPTYVDVWVDRGTLYLDLDNYEQAISDLSRAIRLDPYTDVAFNNRGYAFEEMGNDPRAIEDYTASLAIDPDDPITLRNRGTAYYRLDRYARSVADLDRAIALDPDNPIAYNNRALSREELGDIEGALADYKMSMDLRDSSQWGIVLYNRGLLHYDQEDYELAEADLLASAELIPSDPDVWWRLGDLYVAMGDEDEALRVYQRHVEVAGDRSRYSVRQYLEEADESD